MAIKNGSNLYAWTSEKDLESRFISVSKQIVNYSKAKSDDVFLGKTDYDCPWSRDANIYRQHELDAMSGNAYSMLYPITNPDGEDSLFLHSKIARKSESGIVVGVSCCVVEVFNPGIYKLLLHLKKFSPEEKSLYFLNKKQTTFNFTDREKEILFFTGKGKTAKEVARILKISPKTVEKHIENMKFKTATKSKIELLNFASETEIHQQLPSAFSAEELLKNLLE